MLFVLVCCIAVCIILLPNVLNFSGCLQVSVISPSLHAHMGCFCAEWDGGLVLVSHDFRLIDQVAKEIWVVAKGGVQRWEGDIVSFKHQLRAKHAALND